MQVGAYATAAERTEREAALHGSSTGTNERTNVRTPFKLCSLTTDQPTVRRQKPPHTEHTAATTDNCVYLARTRYVRLYSRVTWVTGGRPAYIQNGHKAIPKPHSPSKSKVFCRYQIFIITDEIYIPAYKLLFTAVSGTASIC